MAGLSHPPEYVSELSLEYPCGEYHAESSWRDPSRRQRLAPGFDSAASAGRTVRRSYVHDEGRLALSGDGGMRSLRSLSRPTDLRAGGKADGR